MHDCRITFILPIPLSADNPDQTDQSNVEGVLVDGDLDYLYYSSRSVPSIDQPGHRGCIITALGK